MPFRQARHVRNKNSRVFTMRETIVKKTMCRLGFLAVLAAVVSMDACPGAAVATERSGQERVRKPAVVGMFYPADKDKLRQVVADSLKGARKEESAQPIKAILAPHAGYSYCAAGMAAAYKQIEGPAFSYDTVVLIGPSHRVRTKAAALSSAAIWETPLGPVPVDLALSRKFAESNDRIQFDDSAHVAEHCLEVQLPYLIVAAGGKPFKIVPLLTNSPDPLDQEIVARSLAEFAVARSTLIVISTDLSHYPSAKTAEKVDRAMLGAVASLNPQIVQEENRRLLLKEGHSGLSVTMCGLEAVLCVERAAPELGVTQAKVISYTHSGMASGDDQRVVGYGAVVFTGSGKPISRGDKEPLLVRFSAQSRKELIAMAQSAVKAAVEGAWVSYDPSDNVELQVQAGCFVTLKNKGELRGCIGRFVSDVPLWRTVREMAVQSATTDARFAGNPIKPSEVPALEVEISVLSPLRRVSEPLKEIQIGRDGILLRDKGRSGTFLPQVATEAGWGVEEFLGHCARDKAGLGWEGWRSPSCQVYVYTTTNIADEK